MSNENIGILSLEQFVKRALNIPFKEKGRSYNGCDCWGVAYLAYRDVKNVFLPRYTARYPDPGNSKESRKIISELILAERQKWIKVDKAQPLDVVLFNVGPSHTHLGIMIDNKNFIHCEKKINTVIESIRRLMWKKRIEGIYRLNNYE